MPAAWAWHEPRGCVLACSTIQNGLDPETLTWEGGLLEVGHGPRHAGAHHVDLPLPAELIHLRLGARRHRRVLVIEVPAAHQLARIDARFSA